MEYTELLVIDKEDFDNLKLDRLVLFNFGSQSLTNFQIHSFGASRLVETVFTGGWADCRGDNPSPADF